MENILGFLDMHTIIFTMVITNLVCTLVMLLLWRQNYKRLDGITFWVADYTLQTITILLIVLRGNIPDWVSIDVANTLSVIGIYLGYRGLERFFHLKSFQGLNYVLLFLYPVIFTWHTLVHPDLAIRNLYIGIFSFLFCIQCVWLLFFRVKRSLLPMTMLVGVVFILYCAVDISRVFDYFVNQHKVINYFEAGSFEAFVLLSYKMLLIILTFGLALMFNKRLLIDIALQEEKFSKAFHTSPYAIVLTHMDDGRILEINEMFLQYSGFSSEEIIDKTADILKFWENLNDRTFVLNELANKRVVQDMEFHFRRKNGEPLIGLFSADIITINGEKCLLSSINDISERKHAEEELKESEAKFRTLFTRMSEGFALHEMIYDSQHNPLDYIILEINPAYEKQVGLSAEMAKGQLATVCYGVDKAPYLDIYAQVATTGEPQSFQTYYPPLDKYYDILAFSPYQDFFATVFLDVTEQRKAEADLLESETRFRNLNATKDKFFSIIAHDLKGPFNSILGFSSVLGESVQAKDYESVEEYASIIRKATLRTMDLLENLLEWARSQTGRMEISSEYIEIGQLVKEVLGFLDPIAKQKDITISMSKLPIATVYADKVLTSTILRNLISNAIKFSNPGSEIQILVEKQVHELKVCIRDTGIGIKEEDLNKLFRIEEGFSKRGTQNEQGTGLGLLLCKEFVEKQGGRISVESVLGKGSTFCFTLPASF